MSRAHTVELLSAITPCNICMICKNGKPIGYEELAVLLAEAGRRRDSRP
jgi:hypothetical protein